MPYWRFKVENKKIALPIIQMLVCFESLTTLYLFKDLYNPGCKKAFSLPAFRYRE